MVSHGNREIDRAHGFGTAAFLGYGQRDCGMGVGGHRVLHTSPEPCVIERTGTDREGIAGRLNRTSRVRKTDPAVVRRVVVHDPEPVGKMFMTVVMGQCIQPGRMGLQLEDMTLQGGVHGSSDLPRLSCKQPALIICLVCRTVSINQQRHQEQAQGRQRCEKVPIAGALQGPS